MNRLKLYLIIFISSLCIDSNAQNKDSLFQILDNTSEIDSGYFETLKLYLKDRSLNYSEIDIDLIIEAKDAALRKGNKVLASEMLYELGYYHYQRSQMEESIDNYLSAINLIKNNDQNQLLLRYYTDLSNSYNALGDSEQAIEMNLKTIAIVKNDLSSPLKARYYFYTAKSYDRLRQFDNAELYYLEAKRIAQEANFPFGVVLSNSSLGHNYNEQGKFKQALPLVENALESFIESGQELNVAGAHSTLANTYRGLKIYDKAVYHYEQAIDAYKNLQNTSYLKYNYTWLAYSYKMLGKSEEAFKNYDLAIEYADTLFDQQRLEAVEELKTQFETEKYKQEKLIADAENLLATERANRSNLVSTLAIIFAVVVSLLIGLIFNRLKLIRKQKKELDKAYAQLEESKKNELAVSNLKALQSQMNPHFIFNALNSVQDLVLLQDIRNSNKYLGKFSDLIRKILLSSKKQFISLTEEVEILSLYLDLEKLRFGEEFQIDFVCNVSSERQDEIQLPAMFIQPYIENAIKHGLFHKEGLKQLQVYFNLSDEYHLECIVKDNGIGQKQAAIYKEKRLHLHTGFSTEAINERIRLLNETLDQKIEIDIIDLFENEVPVGTKICLTFPI